MKTKRVGMRGVNAYGSINIPVELRREMGIQPYDWMSIEATNEGILIRPFNPRCTFCGNEAQARIGTSGICKACARKAVEMIEKKEAENEHG